MKSHKILIISFLTLFASLSAASAQSAVKTWVSSVGSDRGQCDISAPCGSIQYALNQTAAGGEVEVRDPGNYGPFSITRSVSVIASTGGATLSDYGNGNAGIFVQAGASDIVTIRGFTINGHNAFGATGILISAGAVVIIDHCIISGATIGINFTAPNTYVMITNNQISQNHIGIAPGNVAYVALGGDVIAGNDFGIYGGTVHSYGDNLLYTGNINSLSGVTTQSVSKY